jgi:hypothetical protein
MMFTNIGTILIIFENLSKPMLKCGTTFEMRNFEEISCDRPLGLG